MDWSKLEKPSDCEAVCGDGTVVSGQETCDLGNVANPTRDDVEGCVKCQEQTGFSCDTSGCTPECGDEHLVGSEECEANGTAVEGCSNCMVQEGWECSEAVPTVCSPICGDGLVKTGETCDYGLNPNPDLDTISGCIHCQKQDYFTCTGVGSGAHCTPDCGDGFIRGSETCDRPIANGGCN